MQRLPLRLRTKLKRINRSSEHLLMLSPSSDSLATPHRLRQYPHLVLDSFPHILCIRLRLSLRNVSLVGRVIRVRLIRLRSQQMILLLLLQGGSHRSKRTGRCRDLVSPEGDRGHRLRPWLQRPLSVILRALQAPSTLQPLQAMSRTLLVRISTNGVSVIDTIRHKQIISTRMRRRP